MAVSQSETITSVEDLRVHLQFAIGLEWATIPAYLAALYSIPDGDNTAASGVIQSVVIEEMLHMALAANVLNAIGGEPSTAPVEDVPAPGTVSSPVPVFPGQIPFLPTIELHLRRFSPEALDLFLEIEHPASETPACPDVGYGSIGAFYHAICVALEDENICPDSLFEEFAETRGHCQIRPQDFYGGAGVLHEVTCRQDAVRAIGKIVTQGEGISESVLHEKADERGVAVSRLGIPVGDDDVLRDGWKMYSHYARFREIRAERHYRPDQDIGQRPAGAVLPVDWDRVYPMATDPGNPDKDYSGTDVEAALHSFDVTYTTLVDDLYAAFNGRRREEPDDLTMTGRAVTVMWALKHQAVALMKTPSPIGDDRGQTVGPSFRYLNA